MDFQLREYFRTFGYAPTKSALALECYGTELQPHIGRYDTQKVSLYTKEHQGIIEIPDNILETVSRVNKMVKHGNCKNPLRNKFYSKKHKFIVYLYEHGMVDKVLESEKNYHFFIGNYSFHQPKVYFMNREISVDGTEEYKPAAADAQFDWNEFKKAINGMIVFVHTGQTSLDDCTESYKHMKNGKKIKF